MRPRRTTTLWPSFDASPYLRWYDPEDWTCWHLVRAFHERELGIDLPDYAGDSRTVQFVAAETSTAWLEVAPPAFGDVAVFGLTREAHGHVGVVVESRSMLHVVAGRATKIDRFDGPGWMPTLRGFFRWMG